MVDFGYEKDEVVTKRARTEKEKARVDVVTPDWITGRNPHSIIDQIFWEQPIVRPTRGCVWSSHIGNPGSGEAQAALGGGAQTESAMVDPGGEREVLTPELIVKSTEEEQGEGPNGEEISVNNNILAESGVQTPEFIANPPSDETDIIMVSKLQTALSRGMKSPLADLLTETSWIAVLESQFLELYLHDLTRFLNKEFTGKHKIFPPLSHVFNAFNSCPFGDVKVVILGQDPYHDDGQAMGLSFSVPQGFKLPSSLLNIFKELETDLGVPRSTCGDLTPWAQQGVLLLNAVLTVRAHQANSHEGKGWERFTDFVIKTVSEKCENVVFMLWGKFAEKKAARVDSKRHLVLRSAHPSGLSASRGFFGCKHFSQANAYLKAKGREEVNWSLL